MTRSHHRWPIPRAKTAVPRLPATFVARARVRRRLARLAAEFPVTLVCAPAGYGKTLLLADWVAATGDADKIWVGVDADDNDADRFWTAVRSAIRAPGATQDTDTPAVLAEVAEIIDALACLPAPTYLILDDLHELHGADTLHGIATLIQHQPDNLRLVLSTRIEPPLPLARLRLPARLAELRTAELRLSHEDTAELMRLAGVPLTDDQVRLLGEQTAGWPAGLRLAARSLRAVTDRDAFLARFAGTDRAVADFLVGEVLTRLPTRTTMLLQVVSVCDEVTPALATELSGQRDAGATLAALERDSALVLGTGADRQWFRPHPLLRSYLRADLARQHPDLAAELHAKAAHWFAAMARPATAFDHAARTGEPFTSVTLLRRHAVALLLAGDHHPIRRALDTAGEVVGTDPWLTLIHALTHLQTDDLPRAHAELRHSQEIWPAHPDEDLVTLHRLATASYALAKKIPGTTDWPALAGALAGTDLESWARLGLGWTRLRAGDRVAARRELGRTTRLAGDHGLAYVSQQSLTAVGVLSAMDGDYDAMAAACAESLTIAQALGWRTVPGLALNHLLTALSRLLRLDPESALARTRLAATAITQPARPDLRYLTDVLTGAATFDTGARMAGLALLQQARRDVPAADLPVVALVGGALLEHRCAVALGRKQLATDVATWTRANAGAVAEVTLMRALSCFANGDAGAAETAVREVLDESLPASWPTTRLEATLLETAVEIRNGHRTRARAALTSALSLAEPSTLIRPFHQADPSVRQLLREQLGGFGQADGFAARVSRALSTVDGQSAGALTYRERAVLARLSTPRSLDEVAADLTVSVNTVKTHVRAIYAKLGVTNRRAAVVAGRRLGLT
ncbi:LuxR C-terminal-related transcriptional regulator [Actinophytocola sediminis]